MLVKCHAKLTSHIYLLENKNKRQASADFRESLIHSQLHRTTSLGRSKEQETTEWTRWKLERKWRVACLFETYLSGNADTQCCVCVWSTVLELLSHTVMCLCVWSTVMELLSHTVMCMCGRSTVVELLSHTVMCLCGRSTVMELLSHTVMCPCVVYSSGTAVTHSDVSVCGLQ